MHSRVLISALVPVLFLLAASPAEGIIVVTPKPDAHIPWSPVQLIEQNVDVKLTDRAAEVSVECTYYNIHNTVLEGTWIFPLPPEAAVDRFSMIVGGEEIEAELLDAAEARRIYESIVRQTRDPALLEYIDRQLLRARIFPIEPLKEVGVKLYYTHPLTADFGTTDFVFPILNESWAMLLHGDGRDRRSTMTITIETQSPLGAVTVPTHDAEVVRQGPTRAIVKCAPEVLRQAGDFHLLCTYDTRELSAQFLTTTNEDGSFFMGIITPGNGEELDVLAKDVVFCFDRSGSMHGEKIRQAREALRFCLNTLNPEDRFGMVIFNDALDLFREDLADADPQTINAAVRKVEAIEAEGGTHIYGALEKALAFFRDESRPRYLVFLTDGLPTVGITDQGRILSMVKGANKPRERLFTFGVGYDLNAGLLNDLASQHNGYSSFVAPNEDVEIAVSNFFRKLSRPVLADCRIEFAGQAVVVDLYPHPLPDIFAGNEIILFGRFSGAGSVTALFTGLRGAAKLDHSFNTSFRPSRGQYPFVAKLWAGRRIGHLLEQMRLAGESHEVKDEIVRLSKKYGIMTPYTSFLAAPEEVRIAHDFRSLGEGTVQLAPTQVSRSIEESKLKGGQTDAVFALPSPAGQSAARKADASAAGRRFSLLDSVWTDWDALAKKIVPAETLVIKPYSEAYFRLASNRELAAILALGDRVTFLWRNVLIKIDETGTEAWNNRWDQLL